MTLNLDMLARILADERRAHLGQVNRLAWMREDIENESTHTPSRLAGVIVAILALAVVGQMVLS